MATIFEIAWTERAKESHLDSKVGVTVEQDSILRAAEDIISMIGAGSYVVELDDTDIDRSESSDPFSRCLISRNYAAPREDGDYELEAYLLAEVSPQLNE